MVSTDDSHKLVAKSFQSHEIIKSSVSSFHCKKLLQNSGILCVLRILQFLMFLRPVNVIKVIYLAFLEGIEVSCV